MVVAFLSRASGVAGLLTRAADRPEQVPPGTLRRALAEGVFINGSRTGFQEALEVIAGSAARPEVLALGDHALWIGELARRLDGA